MRHLIIKWLSRIVLKTSSREVVQKYREVEKLSLKCCNVRSHRTFNECCLNNKLLPIYTNVRLHDGAARTHSYVNEFRLKLVETEVEKQNEELIKLEDVLADKIHELSECVNSDLRIAAFLSFLNRVCEAKRLSLAVKHQRKLTNLYGSEIFLKQDTDRVLNLSTVKISTKIERILSLGLNCHIKTGHNIITKQIEVEKLYK